MHVLEYPIFTSSKNWRTLICGTAKFVQNCNYFVLYICRILAKDRLFPKLMLSFFTSIRKKLCLHFKFWINGAKLGLLTYKCSFRLSGITLNSNKSELLRPISGKASQLNSLNLFQIFYLKVANLLDCVPIPLIAFGFIGYSRRVFVWLTLWAFENWLNSSPKSKLTQFRGQSA